MIQIKYKGKTYKSVKELCERYGITVNYFNYRRSKGISVEEILTKGEGSIHNLGPVKDHKGKEYKTKKEMCAKWGIGYGVYTNRLENGYSLKDSLTLPVQALDIRRDRVDHKGIVYPTQTKMCEAWGISNFLFSKRRSRGCSVEYALTTPKNARRVK